MSVFDEKPLRDDRDVAGFTPPTAPKAQPAAKPSAAKGQKEQGTKVGHLTLIPGSGLDSAVKAVGRFKENYNRAYHLPRIISPDNPRSMHFAPPSVGAQGAGTQVTPGPAAGAAPIASAQAAPAPVVQPPAMHLIEGNNPQSLGITPPSSSAPPAPPPQAPSNPVVGQFNGRDYTREQVNALAAQLPTAAAGAAPVAAPGGGYAFAPPAAGSLAQASGATAMPAQTPLQVPRFLPPGFDTRRVAAAEKERAAFVGQLDDQIRQLQISPSGLNSRSKRQLFAELLAQRAGLTQHAGDLAGSAAGQQLNAATSAGIAGMGQQGENARALLRERGDTGREAMKQAGETARVGAALNPPEYRTNADGHVVLTRGARFTPVRGPDGMPLLAPPSSSGAITPQLQLDVLVQQLQSELDPNRRRALAGQINEIAFERKEGGGR